jgi:CheY-like chemotaxis protein
MAHLLSNRLEILVIDDERDKRVFFREILEKQGFTVIWCRDWNEVNQLLSDRTQQGEPFPDIVLVDMYFFEPFHMLGDNPAMEGVRIIQKFSESCEIYGSDAPPIIGFTGNEDYIQRQEMVQAGVSDFITAEEFKNPVVLGRRLIQCIQEAQLTRMLKPPKAEEIQEIEDKIVSKVLSKYNDNVYKAADFLRWSVTEVQMVRRRLQEKRNSHVR